MNNYFVVFSSSKNVFMVCIKFPRKTGVGRDFVKGDGWLKWENSIREVWGDITFLHINIVSSISDRFEQIWCYKFPYMPYNGQNAGNLWP